MLNDITRLIQDVLLLSLSLFIIVYSLDCINSLFLIRPIFRAHNAALFCSGGAKVSSFYLLYDGGRMLCHTGTNLISISLYRI